MGKRNGGLIKAINVHKKNLKRKRKESVIQPKKKTTYRYKLQVKEDEKVLFIGEGNFSFALSLADKIHRADSFVCTAFDSKSITVEKYPESAENIQALEDMEGQVLFEVDGSKLTKDSRLKQKKFDYIIFNFPHVGLGIKDQDQNILANQTLLGAFFLESTNFLTSESNGDNQDGQIVVTLKSGLPYDLWDVKQIAKDAGYVLDRSCEFKPDDFPGYAHRRTIGFDKKVSNPDNMEITKKPSRMYIFKIFKETTDP
ncbi:hypothetical protein BC833DRAFT_575183 [Globomyces pollinis-pini]|nr:hypothetical protein BC833DRAFT_575183 [Globomyces pollinis-pini]